MQTPKSRPGSLDVRQRQSGATPLTARKLRTAGSDSDATLSPNPVIKKERSPKLVDRRSPRSPAIEKKRPNRLAELESQLAQLQEELKKAKEQLTLSESSKRMAQQEAQEAKKQLAATSAELESTQKQLDSFSDSEESRVQELRKISKDRDKVWQSELEALQKQHSMDSSALSSAMNEIQRLKIQLERISESEAKQARHAESAHVEIQSLRVELTKTLEHANFLKSQLNSCRESEAETLEEVSRAQTELEVLKSSHESYKSLAIELEQSKNRLFALEELVASLQADLANARKVFANPSEIEPAELHELKHESSQLRALLEAAERRYQDEYLQSTMEIRRAYELVDRTKLESRQMEAELEAKVKIYEAEADELKIKLIEKENEFPKTGENFNENELKDSESILEEIKFNLLEKETRLNSITEENEMLKYALEKEMERSKAIDEAIDAEREALMKLGFMREEADKSCRKTERVTEQLDAAQTANSEMEAELRRLKVQSDQWRKAAEAATAILSTENNGKHIERNGSFDYYTVGGKMDYSEDMDDESPKKKNGNVLRKIGVLLKKK